VFNCLANLAVSPLDLADFIVFLSNWKKIDLAASLKPSGFLVRTGGFLAAL